MSRETPSLPAPAPYTDAELEAHQREVEQCVREVRRMPRRRRRVSGDAPWWAKLLAVFFGLSVGAAIADAIHGPPVDPWS